MYFEKYRELLLDPFAVQFQRVEIESIVSYPHAGNDVIECIGAVDKGRANFFVKFERHRDADFENEIYFLNKLQQAASLKIPKVIETGRHQGINYLVLEKLPGARISFILDKYAANTSAYCNRFGYSLGEIHSLTFTERLAKGRKIHNLPENPQNDPFIAAARCWLEGNAPASVNEAFIHGDHHYANLLWADDCISGILDWELAGWGNKELDLAWAVIPRPGQQFFKSRYEEDEILSGYCRVNHFDLKAYRYYKVLHLTHFYRISADEPDYQTWVRAQVKELLYS